MKGVQRALNTDIPKHLAAVQKYVGKDETRNRQFQKYKSQFETTKTKWDKNLKEFASNAHMKNAVVVKESLGQTYTSSITNEIPIQQAYVQEEFIKNREDKIAQMHSDAKEVREIAGKINEKIYEQDDKFSEINKEMGNNLKDVQEANKELAKAREITQERNKNILWWTLAVAVLVLVLSLTIYFMFFK